MTTAGATATEAARNAFARGLLASGVSVNGLMASNNPQAAAKLFTQATDLDPGMCDAWLARTVSVSKPCSSAIDSVRSAGWKTSS